MDGTAGLAGWRWIFILEVNTYLPTVISIPLQFL